MKNCFWVSFIGLNSFAIHFTCRYKVLVGKIGASVHLDFQVDIEDFALLLPHESSLHVDSGDNSIHFNGYDIFSEMTVRQI